LVRTFRFLPVAGHHPKPVARVTLRPRGGMPLLIAKRGPHIRSQARTYSTSCRNTAPTEASGG
jgi:hypothetical protein